MIGVPAEQPGHGRDVGSGPGRGTTPGAAAAGRRRREWYRSLRRAVAARRRLVVAGLLAAATASALQATTDEVGGLAVTVTSRDLPAGHIVTDSDVHLTRWPVGTVPAGALPSPVGAVLAVYFASSGVESLRIGLNRAYDQTETRNWILLRLESIGYVLIAALGLLALSFLIVLGPLLFQTALLYAPWLEPLEATFTKARFGIAGAVLAIALIVAHKWLPAGRRRILDILPGTIATLLLWLAAGIAFACSVFLWLALPDTPPSVGLPEVQGRFSNTRSGSGCHRTPGSDSFQGRQKK